MAKEPTQEWQTFMLNITALQMAAVWSLFDQSNFSTALSDIVDEIEAEWKNLPEEWDTS